MNRHYKLFTILSLVLVAIFSYGLYMESKSAKQIEEQSIRYQSDSLADLLISLRKVYQDIFVRNHTTLDLDTLELFPVRTTDAIAKEFSKRNVETIIKTVTDRPRNFSNLANERQLRYINYFKQNSDKKFLFEKDGNTHYYAQPLLINELCIKCHGKKSQAPKTIQEHYHTAYNYNLGDVRGIIYIELKQTKLASYLQHNMHIRYIGAIILLIIIIGVLYIYADKNRSLELEVLSKNHKLEKTQQVAHLGHWEYDVANDLLECTNEMYNIFEVKKETNKTAKRAFLDAIHPDDRHKVYKAYQQSIHTKEPYMLEFRLLMKDGRVKWLKENRENFFDNEGRLQKTSGVILEITQLKLLQLTLMEQVDIKTAENLKQQDQIFQHKKKAALGELISIIAHQLKQPLHAIAILTESFMLEIDSANIEQSKMDRFQDGIEQKTSFMASTIDDLRSFFKPDKKTHPFALATTINKTLAIIGRNIKSKGIDIQKELELDLKTIGIESELQQVIINILNNAKDALIATKPSRPYIKIATFQKNNQAIITIEDNGGGIPDKHLQKIFESNFTTKGKEGTGIGLNLCKMIIEDSMNGNIYATNTQDGALFTIILPLNS
jgi:signal transduction histidine kinase